MNKENISHQMEVELSRSLTEITPSFTPILKLTSNIAAVCTYVCFEV